MNQNKGSAAGFYYLFGIITAIISFCGIWLFALNTWGLLFGLIFGWIPALIGGAVMGVIWPIPVLFLLYSLSIT